MHENTKHSICDRLRKDQLDTITLKIPIESVSSEMSFHRLFLLALLIVMGKTLLNCTNSHDEVQKISKIEFVDSTYDKLVNSECESKIDSLPVQTIVGNLKYAVKKNTDTPNIDEVMGLISLEKDENEQLSFITVKNPPEFKDTPQQLSTKEKKDFFKDKMTRFVSDNFVGPQICFNIYGVHRVHSQFVIDSLGFVKDIKVRASHELLEKEVVRVFKLLPQFIPAEQDGKNVSVLYNLPIIFKVEE